MIIGTRPEAIKIAPICRILQADARFDVSIVNTGQHSTMLDQLLLELGISPDYCLNAMTENQGISHLYSRILTSISEVITKLQPRLVLVQGDTTSALAGAHAAFLQGIDVAHVEAGLRTYNLSAPFPEEANRQLIARMTTLHFAPTQLAVQNLINEGIEPGKIHLVGNSIVDSVIWFCERESQGTDVLSSAMETAEFISKNLLHKNNFCIVTLHRRENADTGFRNILSAIKRFAVRNPKFKIIFPVHPNPAIRKTANEMLQSLSNVTLMEPLGYSDFLTMLRLCNFVLTDSGGIQEEAITLGVPVLVARVSTERTEGLSSGLMKVIGSREEEVFQGLLDSLDLERPDGKLRLESNPFGDGSTSAKIKSVLLQFFQSNS